MPRLVAGADGHEARSGSTGPERRPSTSSGPRSTLDEDPPACRKQQRRIPAQTVSTKAAPTSTMTPLWPGLLQRPTKHRRTLELASRGPRRHRHRCPRLIRALRRHRLGIYLAWRVRRREPRPRDASQPARSRRHAWRSSGSRVCRGASSAPHGTPPSAHPVRRHSRHHVHGVPDLTVTQAPGWLQKAAPRGVVSLSAACKCDDEKCQDVKTSRWTSPESSDVVHGGAGDQHREGGARGDQGGRDEEDDE